MFTHDTLAGLTVVVTGGGTGLGLSMARYAAKIGARVALVARDGERVERAAASIRDGGGDAFAHPCDVRDPASVRAAIDAVVARYGAIDGLVNNAAGNFLCAAEDLSPNGFDAVVRVVLHGTAHVTLEVGRRMLERAKGGSIVSIVTAYAWTGSAFVLPSACAKAGVLAMTRSLAVEWAHAGVRLNAVAPGPFPTEGAWKALVPTPEAEEEAKARVPAGRFGEHDELSAVVAFLLSDMARYQTGDCVTIDGGAWLANGGEFNALTKYPREDLKSAFRAMRGR